MTSQASNPQPTCVVVGSLNVDMTIELPALPRRGETMGGGRFRSGPGGKGANQAAATARLGAKTYFIGRVGQDAAGETGRRYLRQAGVDDSHLSRDPVQPTGVALIMVGRDGENQIGLASGANEHLTPDIVTAAIDQIARVTPDVTLLTCLEVPLETVTAACLAARNHHWRVVLNPAPGRPLSDELLASVDVLTPNAVEAEQISSGGAARLLDLGVGTVVVTRGADGAEVWQRERRRYHVPAFDVDVVDATGAGDAFTAALSWALSAGRDVRSAVQLASAAGALTASVLGTRPDLTETKLLRLFHAAGERPNAPRRSAGRA